MDVIYVTKRTVQELVKNFAKFFQVLLYIYDFDDIAEANEYTLYLLTSSMGKKFTQLLHHY